jgi:hypothetical protein
VLNAFSEEQLVSFRLEPLAEIIDVAKQLF